MTAARRGGRRAARPGRRRAAAALGTALAVALAALALAAGLRGRLDRPITRIVMENEWRQVGEEAARGRLRPFLGAGFFSFDAAGAKAELEGLPWVRHARLRRRWPDGLSVALTEEEPIARWGDGGLLNRDGEIFRPEEAFDGEGLPVLAGPEGSQRRVMEQYRVVGRLLFPAGLKVAGLRLSPRGGWSLTLERGPTVTVGREDVPERLRRLAGFYGARPAAAAAMVSADLRYAGGIAVKGRRPPPAGAGPADGPGERGQ